MTSENEPAITATSLNEYQSLHRAAKFTKWVLYPAVLISVGVELRFREWQPAALIVILGLLIMVEGRVVANSYKLGWINGARAFTHIIHTPGWTQEELMFVMCNPPGPGQSYVHVRFRMQEGSPDEDA